MKLKKKHSFRVLSLLLCLLLAVSVVPLAGVFSASANSLAAGLYLKGNMNGWNCYEQYKFVEEGNGIYSLVIDMTGGNYEFKIATPNWSTSIGDAADDEKNAHLVIEADSIVKFTANTKTKDYTAEIMNTKSDFTLGASKATIEAEKYTFALGEVGVLEGATSGGKYVGNFDQGDSINFGTTVTGDKAVTYRIEMTVASKSDNGEFYFTTGKQADFGYFTTTGSWDVYKTMVFTRTLQPGYNRITIENLGGTYNVDKLVFTPVTDEADAIKKGDTTLDFKNYDAASDTALIKNGKITGAELNEYVSVIVKPEQSGVYVVSLDDAATEKGNVFVYTKNYENAAYINEETPTAEFVIDGETEIFLSCQEGEADVSSINFSYIDNVEQMGYAFSEAGYSGVRFANEFEVKEIVLSAEEEDIPAGKVMFSDGTYFNTKAISADDADAYRLATPKNATWVKFEAEGAEAVGIQVKGLKIEDSATDIGIDGYVSSPYGWDYATNYAYTNIKAENGKVGFGFNEEVTVDKVVFVGIAGNSFEDNIEFETAVPDETVATDPSTAAPATTAPAETEPQTTVTATAEATEPATTVTATSEATEPQTTVTATAEATEPATTVTATSEATEPQTTVTATAEATEPQTTVTATAETTAEGTEPDSSATEPTSTPVVTYLLGDADEDGKVNIKDATTIQKHSAKILTLYGLAITRADVNSDDVINIKDATAIQKHIAKFDTGYAIGQELTTEAKPEAEAELVAVAAAVPAAEADAPIKATLTTASNKKIELTGKVVGNDVEFELDDIYSFGFFFDFGEEINVNAIQVYGNPEYKGGSVNVSDAQDYTLFVNGLTENNSRVIANTGSFILTSETGSDREWVPTVDVEDSPVFRAPNTPLAEAAYNLTMEEIYKSINYDETFGDVFYTGTNWHKVWTRDTAISMQYILSWLFPEISTNCAEAKVVGKDGNLTFEEDTGTGGSYPVSTDRIIMMLAVWETYLADGNKETLEYFYNVASNTIMQDYEVVYDEEAGLFRGETCGLDHRDKTYGDWTDEEDENGIVTIAEGKAASTNILFCQAMKILSESALILGKGEAESKAWADLAADLEKAIADRLWLDDLGTYTSWEYPDWMGSPLAYKQDVLANGYAVLYNIGGQEKADSIMENHTLVPFGANTVYPQKNAKRWTGYKYHDSGVWPGWEAILMIGAVNNENENNLLAEEIWNSCIRGAVACLTNYEVIDYETGEGLHSTQQLWSVAATMAGYYRVLYGMEYTTEGITFDPYVPQWMEGPFYVDNYKYRNATLNLELNGKGDTVESIFVNGEQVDNDYVLPTDTEGNYDIVITVKDSGAEDIINLKAENTAKAPNAPEATLTGTTLKWNRINNCTYKVWTGSEYKDVTDTTYTIDDTAYGCYSVVAVDKTTGLWSELSKPITYSPLGSNVTAYVGDKKDTATFKVNIPVDGEYQLSSIHTNMGDPTAGITAAIRSVYVDGEDVGTLVFPAHKGDFNHQLSSHLRLTLKAGTHEVTVKYATENWYDRNMSNAHGQQNNTVTFHMFQFTLVDGAFSEIEPPAKKVIYFTNNKNWSKVNIFFWGGADSTDWPGTAMTYVGKNKGNEDVYKYELDPSTPNIIFNNGQQQTVDIVSGVEDGMGFYILDSTDSQGKYNVGTYVYGE